MNTDPKSPMPLPPLRLPKSPSAVGGLQAAKFVPNYALEAVSGRTGSATGGGSSVATELHFNNGVTQIDVDANGVKVTELATGRFVQLESSGTFTFSDFASNTIRMTDDGLQIYNAGAPAAVEIFFAALARNMAIRTIDVCDSGSPAYMDIIGSEPYT